MKTFIFATALFLGSASFALAATDHNGVPCQVPPDNGIYSVDGTELVGCNKAADVARAKAENDARQSKSLPVIVPGTVITDGKGRFDICPLWFNKLNCVIVDPAFRDSGLNYGRPNGADFGAVQRYFPDLKIGAL